jgi:putative hemolysin
MLRGMQHFDPRPLAIAPPARVRAPRAPLRLEVTWARQQDEVRAAQALRWRVFADELGATLRPPRGTPPGHDADLYDGYCEHLLVRTLADDHEPAHVVGTCRLLTPAAAQRVGSLYSGEQFDLAPLAPIRRTLAEVGRACVDAHFRRAGVTRLLWGELLAFMQRNGVTRMIGCASLTMRDGGHYAASLWHRLAAAHMAAPEYRVSARLPLPVDGVRYDGAVTPPPLIRGYLHCGAKLLGAPAWDPAFNTADLALMLHLDDLPAAYRRRLLPA